MDIKSLNTAALSELSHLKTEPILEIISRYASLPGIRAIAIGGSIASGHADSNSDIDLYIFSDSDITVETRSGIIKPVSSRYEIGGDYFGPGDEYYYDSAEREFDVMYWNCGWFEGLLNDIWKNGQAWNGYTTAFLYTLKNFLIVYDPQQWLANLQQCLDSPYPQELKRNIIRRNMMLLCDKPFSSCKSQIVSAVKKNDFISINHRIAAFIASYFDIIFAVNELLHPGEKRLVQFAEKNCKILPDNFSGNLAELAFADRNNTSAIPEVLEKIIMELRKIIPA